MPLGNYTSQFFANIYLNELDQFVKHQLRTKHYIRYVDDFVLFHHSKETLQKYQSKINQFLKEKLNLELHPDKSKILKLNPSIDFLGFRIFYHHKLLKKRNLKTIERKLDFLYSEYSKGQINYDQVYDFLEGWLAYAKKANTHKLRKRILKQIEAKFSQEISTKEINRSLKISN